MGDGKLKKGETTTDQSSDKNDRQENVGPSVADSNSDALSDLRATDGDIGGVTPTASGVDAKVYGAMGIEVGDWAWHQEVGFGQVTRVGKHHVVVHFGGGEMPDAIAGKLSKDTAVQFRDPPAGAAAQPAMAATPVALTADVITPDSQASAGTPTGRKDPTTSGHGDDVGVASPETAAKAALDHLATGNFQMLETVVDLFKKEPEFRTLVRAGVRADLDELAAKRQTGVVEMDAVIDNLVDSGCMRAKDREAYRQRIGTTPDAPQ